MHWRGFLEVCKEKRDSAPKIETSVKTSLKQQVREVGQVLRRVEAGINFEQLLQKNMGVDDEKHETEML